MNENYRSGVFFLVIILAALLAFPVEAQRRGKTAEGVSFDENLYSSIKWRSIGPFRGGRSAAVTGVPGKEKLFYMGTTGGGVWKTEDGGNSWINISDGYFGGSIGSIAVSEYDPNVIYVGGGEVTVRGNVSSGLFGMFKSVDGGDTWTEIGLKNSMHIPRIKIHPKNPDLVYAAVMGDLYKSSEERGVYRSKDGGKTWERILFANADAGAVELSMDPNNPRILFASTWRIRRTPYSLESGGDGSALWKSTDGGDTWANISNNEGLPEGTLGIIGVSVSPVNSKRVWAIIENQNGGVFRSDDGGTTWRKTNSDRSLRQRAWYYSKIYADTQNEDKVWVMNVAYGVSSDGGKSFELKNAPHGDHHDFWQDPFNSNSMIIADDGGGQVSSDGGTNWTTYHNQPTAQFYRVTTDNHFPYRIYGAQQDNSTVRILHRSNGRSISEDDWEPSAGGESAHLAPHPTNPDIVYGGSYGGLLTRVDHKNEQIRVVNVWPNNPMGHGAEDMKYRFQWNFPIFFSPHDPNKLYTASNHLHVTTNEGQSWDVISPDLTRNDPTKLGPSGGPITKDNTAVEYYCTIFAACESPFEKDLLWTGSDDGLIHVSRDGGNNWENVTPSGMPEWMMINSIDPDPFVKGGAYVAGTRYKMGDNTPYLYKTKDYGKTWTRINSGIPGNDFTRVVRADPKRAGLLYAGTESGMYISFDDGVSWKPFQLNLPTVPITDLAIKDDNLIAATQGRSFWVIDDLTPLHQLTNEVASSNMHLYKPMPTYRMPGGSTSRVLTDAGENHPGGVMVHYFANNISDSSVVSIEFLESDGDLIKKYSTDAKDKKEMLEVEKGSNRFVWNMRYPDAEGFKGLIMWAAGLTGPKAVPGTYKVRLTVDSVSSEQEFEIMKDPRSNSTNADLQAQFDFLIAVRDKFSETSEAITQIRDVKGQVGSYMKRLDPEKHKDIIDKGKSITKSLTEVEEELYQTKNQSRQDPLNYPIRLNNKLGHLSSVVGRGDYPPTDQSIAVKDEISGLIDEQLNKLNSVMETEIPEFNRQIKGADIDPIEVTVSEPIN